MYGFVLSLVRREATGEVGLAADLAGLQEDVIGQEAETGHTDPEAPDSPTNQGIAVMRSVPTNKVFIEEKGGPVSRTEAKSTLDARVQIRTQIL